MGCAGGLAAKLVLHLWLPRTGDCRDQDSEWWAGWAPRPGLLIRAGVPLPSGLVDALNVGRSQALPRFSLWLFGCLAGTVAMQQPLVLRQWVSLTVCALASLFAPVSPRPCHRMGTEGLEQ